MLSHKNKYTLESYISMLSDLEEHAYKSSIKAASELKFSNSDSICKVLEFARIYLVADLAAAYFYFGDATKTLLERALFEEFYQTYPDNFIADVKNAIKSHDTMLGDVCSLLAEELSQGAIEKLELLCFIRVDLTASLEMFANVFRATKYKDGYFTVNFKKLNKKSH